MPTAIGFDVYGTLVDPLEMQQHLRRSVGDLAERFSELWREKQIEYAFRRGLMQNYQNFGVCTQQALLFTMQTLKVDLSVAEQAQLIADYQHLRAFPDVVPGLSDLKAQGYALVAFSNGVEETVRNLLEQAGILSQLDGVVSVDELKTFKPDPKVYAVLAQKLDNSCQTTWLVSSNPWDVIGAKSAGLKSAWLQRQPEQVFDPWGIVPDLVVSSIEELSAQLQREG